MQGKSDTEYWRSKLGNPVRAEEPKPEVITTVAAPDRLPAALVFSTFMLCLTAILVTVIVKL